MLRQDAPRNLPLRSWLAGLPRLPGLVLTRLALLTRVALLTGFPRLTGLLARVLTGLPLPPLFLLPIELNRPAAFLITTARSIPLSVRRMLRRELAILVRHVGAPFDAIATQVAKHEGASDVPASISG
jgi:hypothetical protein